MLIVSLINVKLGVEVKCTASTASTASRGSKGSTRDCFFDALLSYEFLSDEN